jgi:hypothetical protein
LGPAAAKARSCGRKIVKEHRRTAATAEIERLYKPSVALRKNATRRATLLMQTATASRNRGKYFENRSFFCFRRAALSDLVAADFY